MTIVVTGASAGVGRATALAFGALVTWAIDGKGSLPRRLSARLDRVLASVTVEVSSGE